MRRYRRIAFVVALFGVVCAAWYYSPSARLRRKVDYWVHQTEWRKDLSPWDADAREQAELLALGPGVVDLLAGGVAQDISKRQSLEQFALGSGVSHGWLRDYFENRMMLAYAQRTESIRALGLLGTNAAPAVPALLDARAYDPVNVARALGAIGVRSEAVINALSRQETDSIYTGMALMASVALWQLQPGDTTHVERVNKLLADPKNTDSWVSAKLAALTVCESLETMGASAQPFVPGLRAFMAIHPDRLSMTEITNKAAVCHALWKITGSSDAAVSYFSYCANASNGGLFSPEFPQAAALWFVAGKLSDIPEFCRHALPVLKLINVSDQMAVQLQTGNVLARMNQTVSRKTSAITGKP